MWGRASSAGRSSTGLALRRRTKRRRAAVALLVLLLLLFSASIYGLRQSAVRVSHVEIFGADELLADLAASAMRGDYFGIIPRDSVFFFPEEQIRANILDSHNELAAVSISRNGLTGISIKVDYRVPIARWCGLSPTEGVEEYCYVFDANGIIFSAVSSTTRTVNAFKLYAPLDVTRGGQPAMGVVEPLHAAITHANTIPAVFDFARQLPVFGSSVVSIVTHKEEVDAILASGTRITYLLGREEDALTALVSARENLNLADGSVEYVDLRFDGKVYVKRNE